MSNEFDTLTTQIKSTQEDYNILKTLYQPSKIEALASKYSFTFTGSGRFHFPTQQKQLAAHLRQTLNTLKYKLAEVA